MHPVEKKTNGLYSNPVAILDFASLYPTLYRAHNLCYTTLLHKDDATSFPADQVTETPIGDFKGHYNYHRSSPASSLIPACYLAVLQGASRGLALCLRSAAKQLTLQLLLQERSMSSRRSGRASCHPFWLRS